MNHLSSFALASLAQLSNYHNFMFSIYLCLCSISKCNYLAHSSLRSREGEEVVRFSGKARKTNHLFSLARAKRARD
ncbi:MAG: hypothetical protein U5L45_06190 [Saprospiraceae bacterium]|nr:hypothetical protein [Saprospiraceae bacterium]